MGAERAVEAGEGGRAHQAGEGEQAAGHLEHVARHPAQRPGLGPRRPHLLVGRLHDVLQRVQHELEAGRLGLRRPLRRLRAHRVGAQVHDHRQQVRAGDPVDQGVVRLGQHRPAAVLEALDHPDLPERLGAVELLRHDPADELAQLALATGGGQRRVAQVVLNVEMRVVDPDRAPQLERDEADLLAVARDQVQLGVHHGDDVAEGRRGTLEDGHRGDVHVGHVVLNVEERRVQRAQAIRTHRPSLRGHPLRRSLPPAGAAFPGSARGSGGERAAQRRRARAWRESARCVSSYAASMTCGPRSSAMARSPMARRDSAPGSRLITTTPASCSRAISRSMRRCTVRRNQPSAPLALPVRRRHGGDDDHHVEPLGPEDVRVRGRVHTAVDVLGAPDVDRLEVAGDGARGQHGGGQARRWGRRPGRRRPGRRPIGGRCRSADPSGQRLPMCSSRPRARSEMSIRPLGSSVMAATSGRKARGRRTTRVMSAGDGQVPRPQQRADGRGRERLHVGRAGCGGGWRRPGATWAPRTAMRPGPWPVRRPAGPRR